MLEITRLGEGVDAGGTLGEAPMRRVTDALGRYAERARALGGRAHARGRHERRARCRQPRRLPGARRRDAASSRACCPASEEAATTFAGVCSRAPGGEPVSRGRHARRRRRRRLDRARARRGRRRRLVALAPGRLRAHDRALPGRGRRRERKRSRPAPPQSPSCSRSCRTRSWRRRERVVAVAGTATTVGRDRATEATTATPCTAPASRARRCARCERRLAAMTLDRAPRVPGLEPARAPVIVAGLVVARGRARPLRDRRGDSSPSATSCTAPPCSPRMAP